MVITCNVPPGTIKERFNPFPGSDAALDQDCTCPVDQDKWPGAVQIRIGCPVHVLEKVDG
jgi:hypothetical protein